MQAAARIEQAACAVDVYAHAKVEVGLRCTADHSCKMEYSFGVVAKGFGDELRTCGVPDGVTDPGIQETIRWRGDVDENQFADWLRIAASVVDMAASKQFTRNALAKEAASTSNDNLHRDNLRGKGQCITAMAAASRGRRWFRHEADIRSRSSRCIPVHRVAGKDRRS